MSIRLLVQSDYKRKFQLGLNTRYILVAGLITADC